jgi:carbon storage regulator CsrA
MLVLTRKDKEGVQIGDDILVVVHYDGRRVRLAIQAPSDKRIMRTELLLGQPLAVATEPTRAAG